ncbi:RNHCP domain-containing protein [Bacillus horti]|uniref:RNase P subunit RPR2 n=1 Tax=Caldalkalibacillus horti TaxID=77523 RepID=A0ABT9VX70_9BACI|nr:RNHCP domain-containing protein [Bacillus horti]MDQ0165407.1 RNase P subunit RPR2 [Bacillus horti]
MSKKAENNGFMCEHCGAVILPLTNGSYRNHCPECLYSKHMDEDPGDRQSTCKGLMKPIDLIIHSKKGYQIIHQCLQCGAIRRNKIAQDTVQSDNVYLLMN